MYITVSIYAKSRYLLDMKMSFIRFFIMCELGWFSLSRSQLIYKDANIILTAVVLLTENLTQVLVCVYLLKYLVQCCIVIVLFTCENGVPSC